MTACPSESDCPITELAYTSGVDLAAMVHSRTISATELMTYTLARIDRVNPGLNAIVTLDPERALRDASAIDDQFAPSLRMRFLVG